MGLDSFLFRRGKTDKGKIVLSLKEDKSYEELGYWRKHYIHSIFCEGVEDDNCVEIIITKERLKQILKYLQEDDEYSKTIILKAINDTDFEHEEIFYYAWY